MDENELYVDFRKWPDSGHWHFSVHPLGEDEHGQWFVFPQGAAAQRGEEPPIVYPHTSAMLLRKGAWWMAFWNSDPGQPIEVYVDVATPAVRSPGRVSLVDLDLDVVRRWDGVVEVIDEDEFLEHQEVLKYPEHLISSARRSADELLRLVGDRTEPFGEVGRRWLAQALVQLEQLK